MIFGNRKKASARQELTRRELVAKRRQMTEEAAAGSSSAATFRRSQTISAHRQAEQAPSERQAGWDQRQKRRRLSARIGATLLIIGVALALLWQLSLNITIQTPTSLKDDQREKYAQILDEYYASRPLERLRFLTNRTALVDFISNQAPEVKTADVVSGGSLMSSNLQIVFRQPVAQWSLADKHYFVDDSGIIFEQNYFPIPEVIVKDQSGIEVQSGQEVINRRFLSFLGQAVSLLAKQNLIVTEAILPPDMVRQVDFKVRDYSFAIRMTVDREVAAQVNQVASAIQHINQTGVNPGQYIDVRVNQRVFYK